MFSMGFFFNCFKDLIDFLLKLDTNIMLSIINIVIDKDKVNSFIKGKTSIARLTQKRH